MLHQNWPLFLVACFWYFPLAICLIVFVASMANPESLGFWLIARNGPLISVLPDPSWKLYVLPLILELIATLIILAAYKSGRFEFTYLLVGVAFLWGIWGTFLFLDSIRIS